MIINQSHETSWWDISVIQVIQVIQEIQLIQVIQVKLAHLWPDFRFLIEFWMFLWDTELWRFLCCSLWVVEIEEEINWLRTVRCLDWYQYEESAYHLHFQALSSLHFHPPSNIKDLLTFKQSLKGKSFYSDMEQFGYWKKFGDRDGMGSYKMLKVKNHTSASSFSSFFW